MSRHRKTIPDIIKCSICKTMKFKEEYTNSELIRYANRCRTCKAKDKRRREIATRDFIIDYKKNHPCEICGESRYYVLDFHHKDPSKKEFSLSNFRGSKERILKEISKCMVVCSNCHREIHWKESNETR